MTWIVIAGLVCAVVVLFADHNLAVKRLNGLEEEVVSLRVNAMYGNHPGWRSRELDPWLD